MDANAHMQSLHQRMPVMLDSEQALEWLDHKNQDPAQMSKLILEASQQALDIYPVSKLVNSSRASGPECLEPSGASDPDAQDPSLFDLMDEI
jgi:putative SOS response-associated peptidase YedK